MAGAVAQRFGFPPEPAMLPPSAIDNRIANMRRAVAFLLSGLFTSIVIHAVTIPMIFSEADVIPYVADGGVFGCQVPILTAPIPPHK